MGRCQLASVILCLIAIWQGCELANIPTRRYTFLMPDMPESPARPTQEQRRSRTRTAVLEAAAQVFARRGFDAATVDEVAREAGVSKGAVYYSFSSKSDLFVALLRQRTQAWVAAMNGASPEESLPDQAAQAAAGFFADLDADPWWTPLLLEFLAYSARDERAHEIVRTNFFEELHAAVAETTRERSVAAGLDYVPVDDLAAGISALACGLGIQRSFTHTDEANAVMSMMLELLIEGLIARNSRVKP